MNHEWLRRHGFTCLVSLGLGLFLVCTLQKHGLQIWPEEANLDKVRLWTVPLYLVFCAGTHYCRAMRWRYLLRPFATVSHREILSASSIGFAAILLLPFRLGEFVRPWLIGRNGVSKTAAFGTILAERIVDGLCLSLLLAWALLCVPTLDPLPERVLGLPLSVSYVRAAGFGMVGLFGCAFAVIALFYAARQAAQTLTRTVLGLVSKPLAERCAGTAAKLAEGLHFLGRPRDALLFLAETALYWCCNLGGMWLLAWGCGLVHPNGTPITLGEVCALMGMLGVTLVLPSPPGLLGVFQAGLYAGMSMYFPPSLIRGPGATYIFLLYTLQLVWQVAIALYFFFSRRPPSPSMIPHPPVKTP